MRKKTKDFMRAKNAIGKITRNCQECEKIGLIVPWVEVHHIDENHENNLLENLMPVCKLCHMKKHHPGIKRLLPYNLSSYRKNKEIRRMMYAEEITIKDIEYLKTLNHGEIILSKWVKY